MKWAVTITALLLVSVGLAAIVTVPLGGRGGAGPAGATGDEPLPVIADAPAWSFTASDGSTVTSESLRGTPYVADFIFTRCKLACPMMTATLADVQRRLAGRGMLGRVKLVSFSIDPEHDTPEVLAEFKARYDASDEHWRFLTGPSRDDVWRLVREGFLLPVEDDPANELMPIQHSTRFVLVDGRGRVRGYYHSDDPADLVRLVDDAIELAG